MITELLEHSKLEEALPWITPIIQGFVQIDRLAIQVIRGTIIITTITFMIMFGPRQAEVVIISLFLQDDNSAEVCLTQDNGTWVECNPPAQVSACWQASCSIDFVLSSRSLRIFMSIDVTLRI